jgi:integrase
MTPLRRRMLQDMQLRGFSARTQECYAAAVRQLAEHYHRSPDLLTEEDLRQYFLYLANEKKVARATATIALCGIRFFFEQTLRRDWTTLRFVRPTREHKLPVVLSRDEVRRVLAAVRIPVYRVCLTTIYACGLRLLEGGAAAGRRCRQCADGGARPAASRRYAWSSSGQQRISVFSLFNPAIHQYPCVWSLRFSTCIRS